MDLDVDALRIDQHPTGDGVFVSARYTPWGIRQLETRFCLRIHGAKTLAECRSIARELREDLHLHPIIKKNLRLNLRRTVQHLKTKARRSST